MSDVTRKFIDLLGLLGPERRALAAAEERFRQAHRAARHAEERHIESTGELSRWFLQLSKDEDAAADIEEACRRAGLNGQRRADD